MARIDRLAEAPKKTLQLASVIGREFTRRLLDRISDIRGQTEPFLRELKGIELIYEKSLFPELAYMFKHALTHDVAYNSLLVQRRKDLHHLIALAVEELYADRLADQYEVLAHHFSKAEDWPRAFDYLVKAGEKAAQGFATREALALYQQALDVAAHLGEAAPATTVMAIHQARSDIYMVTSDFVRAHEEGERVLGFARRIGDQVTTATALGGMALASFFGHGFERALGHARETIALAAGGRCQAGARTRSSRERLGPHRPRKAGDRRPGVRPGSRGESGRQRPVPSRALGRPDGRAEELPRRVHRGLGTPVRSVAHRP